MLEFHSKSGTELFKITPIQHDAKVFADRFRLVQGALFSSAHKVLLVRILCCSTFNVESEFNGHLPVFHLPLVNVAAHFDHLEPDQVLEGPVRALNGRWQRRPRLRLSRCRSVR